MEGFKIGMIGLLSDPSGKAIEIERQLVSKYYAQCDILTYEDDWDKYNYLYIRDKVSSGFDIKHVFKKAHKLFSYVYRRKGGVVKSEKMFEYSVNEIFAAISPPLPAIDEPFELPIKTPKLLIGDMHALSVWPGVEYDIKIQDRKTLAWFLQNSEKADFYYFGNEDIRHYLPKRSNPEQATKELVKDYIALAKQHNAKMSCLLPAESEKRIISKSFYVEGAPYQGSQQLRAKLIDIFNSKLIQSGLDVHVWPEEWYKKPYLYEQTIMEKKPTPYVK